MTPLPTSFSWITLLLMLLLFFASLLMFTALERRCTSQRKWVALGEWARARRMRMRRSGDIPEPLGLIRPSQPWVRLIFSNEHVSILQLQTLQPDSRGWNVLIARCHPWRVGPAALRPVHQPSSLMDLLNLPVMPTPAGTERFLALSTESRAARALVQSKTRALLPPDIGLLRVQQWLVLDFSTRPFDPIELDRMLVLARQIDQLG